MLRTLFYIPAQVNIGGTEVPVFGPGLLLAVWVLICVGILAWLGWRRGPGAETLSYLPLMLLVAAVIWWLLPPLCQQRGLPIRGYGMMMLLAVVAGTVLAAWRARRLGLDPDMIFSLAFWMFLPGILGARVFYVIEYWSDQYLPVYREEGFSAILAAVANVAQGGLVVYGGFIGGVTGLLLFAGKYRLPLLALCDLIAPSIVLGLALGRLGCLLNGCCFGHLCQQPWKISFPWDSPAHVHQVRHGEAFVHALKLSGRPDDRPVIAEVEPGSQAELHGLRPKQQIDRVNGIPTPTTAEATWALLGAHKLHFLLEEEDGRYTRWTIEDPPPPAKPVYQARGGEVSILGLTVGGDGKAAAVITGVKRDSFAARQGLRAGQQIVGVNGRPVPSAEQLRELLETHRTDPWLSIQTQDAAAAVELAIPRPLPRSRPVHPTQVYSAINALLLALLLLAYDPFRRRDGELFALMISIYPISRFLLEIIRTDESAVFHTGLSISQNVSLLLLLSAAGLWFIVLRRPPGRTFVEGRELKPARSP